MKKNKINEEIVLRVRTIEEEESIINNELNKEEIQSLPYHNPLNKSGVISSKYNRKFLEAAQMNNLEVVKDCINNKVNVNTTNSSHYTAIMLASEIGNLEIVMYLASLGADIQTRNNGALRLAAMQSRLEVSKYLLDLGADVNVLKQYDHFSPEIKEALFKHSELIKLNSTLHIDLNNDKKTIVKIKI